VRVCSLAVYALFLAGCRCGADDLFDPSAATSLARFSDRIAWIVEGEELRERVMVRPVDASEPARAVWDQGDVDALAADGDTAVFAIYRRSEERAEVLRISSESAEPQTVAVLPGRASQIAVHGDRIVVRVSRTLLAVAGGGAPTPIAEIPGQMIALAVTPTRAAWLAADRAAPSRICSVALTGGIAECVAEAPYHPSASMRVDGEALWIARGDGAAARIERVDRGSTTPVRVTAPGHTIGALAIDGDVFWVEGDGGGWRRVMKRASGRTTVLASDDHGRSCLEVDHAHVWWATSSGIRRIPR
jgi:hypothetical protein